MTDRAGRAVATPAGRPRRSGQPFFTPLVGPLPRRARFIAQPWSRVPVEFVPTLLPHSELLGTTHDHLALVLTRVTVYPTGLTFLVRVSPRPSDGDAAAAVTKAEFYGQAGGYGSARLRTRLRIGLEYDDGRTATNLAIHDDPWATTPPPALLRIEGGQGGSEGTETEHWAWPIPAAGNLTIVTAWTARGLPERRTVLAGDELRDAAATSAAAELWPGARVPAPTPRSAHDDG